jgi:inward rectifier potassium channel
VHPIDEKSPIYRLTHEDLIKADAEILILLTATDETFSSAVQTRTSYKPDEIKFGHKFVNLYKKAENDQPISIDIRKLSETEEA